MRRRRLKRRMVLLAVLAALAMVLLPFASAGALTTATVTITALPSYVNITVLPTTWSMSTVTPGTDYWGNLSQIEPDWPLQSAQCTWQISSTGSVNYYLDIKAGNMTGGTQWTLETVPDADDFTLIAGGNGTANLAAMKQLSATYQDFVNNVFKTSTVDFEMRMETPTSFSDGEAKSGTMTILAAAS